MSDNSETPPVKIIEAITRLQIAFLNAGLQEPTALVDMEIAQTTIGCGRASPSGA